VLTLLLALATAHAGEQAPAPDAAWGRIVHGQVVKGDDFPAAVALGFDFGRYRMQMCSASLITPKLVLTAGHCTRELAEQYGFPEEQLVAYMKVFFGDDVNGQVRAVGLAAIHVHPRYGTDSRGGIHDDINVLELAEAVDDVEPVWFREHPVKTAQIGTQVTSVGFGITDSDHQNSNGIKRWADLILSDVDSSFIYSNAAENPGNTNICSGDSGGPQYAQVDGRWEQWGVHSFGFGFDSGVDLCLQQSGSTNVGTYADWIWKQIRKVHGDDYVPRFAGWDYCEARGMYLDRHCDPGCAEPDEDCDMDVDGDGEVDDDELAAYDHDGDGEVTPDEAEDGPRKKGCDQSGVGGGLVLAALALAARRRR
jgi:MYXO-CTERM domain-containing protein